MFRALFIPHGGGPMPLLGDKAQAPLVAEWKALAEEFRRAPPTAIVVISAHYETDVVCVGASAMPQMIYDYGGFPPEAYKLTYPAPGNPALAERICHMLQEKGIACRKDASRGYDHGVFVPLMVLFPEAVIPVIPLSVLRSQDPKAHIAIGDALQTLRAEGVLFLGSGSSSHNFASFNKRYSNQTGVPMGTLFHKSLNDMVCSPAMTPAERMAMAQQYLTFQGVEECQAPGEAEHLMPLFTIMGAAGCVPGKLDTHFVIWNCYLAQYSWT